METQELEAGDASRITGALLHSSSSGFHNLDVSQNRDSTESSPKTILSVQATKTTQETSSVVILETDKGDLARTQVHRTDVLEERTEVKGSSRIKETWFHTSKTHRVPEPIGEGSIVDLETSDVDDANLITEAGASTSVQSKFASATEFLNDIRQQELSQKAQGHVVTTISHQEDNDMGVTNHVNSDTVLSEDQKISQSTIEEQSEKQVCALEFNSVDQTKTISESEKLVQEPEAWVPATDVFQDNQESRVPESTDGGEMSSEQSEVSAIPGLEADQTVTESVTRTTRRTSRSAAAKTNSTESVTSETPVGKTPGSPSRRQSSRLQALDATPPRRSGRLQQLAEGVGGRITVWIYSFGGWGKGCVVVLKSVI